MLLLLLLLLLCIQRPMRTEESWRWGLEGYLEWDRFRGIGLSKGMEERECKGCTQAYVAG